MQEQKIRRVAGDGLAFLGRADAAARRHVHRLALGDGQAQQFPVGLADLVGLVQADLLQIDLILDLEVALGVRVQTAPAGAASDSSRRLSISP